MLSPSYTTRRDATLDYSEKMFARHFGQPESPGKGLLYDESLHTPEVFAKTGTFAWTLPWPLSENYDVRSTELIASGEESIQKIHELLSLAEDPEKLRAFLLAQYLKKRPEPAEPLDEAQLKVIAEKLYTGYKARETDIRAHAEKIIQGEANLEKYEKRDNSEYSEDRYIDILAHEVGHALFTANIWSSTHHEQYGGDAPDWLDEAAAILMERGALLQSRFVRFQEHARTHTLIPMARYLHMRNPAYLASKDRPLAVREFDNNIKDSPVSVHRLDTESGQRAALFYAQTRGFVDYLLARTGEDRVFLDIAEHLKAGGSMASWLRDGPTARGAALPRTLEGFDADFRAWARG